MEILTFTQDERQRLVADYLLLYRHLRTIVDAGYVARLRRAIENATREGFNHRDSFGFNPVNRSLVTALTLCKEINPDADMVAAIMLFNPCRHGYISVEQLKAEWGDDVTRMVESLMKVSSLYAKATTVQSDNFRRIMLTFAENIRVIIIMIIDRLVLMRAINHHPDETHVADVAHEAKYLYAPLAHRLGLYAIKSELEDMSLKYTNREEYMRLAHELNQTKASRDEYIDNFIAPIKAKLLEAGLKFEIKGRTKSIYSIWNKLQRQKNQLKDIYDLFAIRIILDSKPSKEKSDCWLAFSIVTNMYAQLPGRMKDWISFPKSNGYESLHTTVVDSATSRWVEVQIRTQRMDLIAEKGLAAHWKYKGVQSENQLDSWMNNVRDILESAESGPLQHMRNVQMNVYEQEVFVFTPRGEVYKLPKGATLLDFAFNVHTNLGTHCVGGLVNGKNRKINFKLSNGDMVEVLSSASQQPNVDWLGFAITSKARNKIRVALKELESRAGDLGKEMLQRRCKNRKIVIGESYIPKLIKKFGYKNITEFYSAISDEQLPVNEVIEAYLEMERKEREETARISADTYVMPVADEEETSQTGNDVVVIGEGIKGINYRLAHCCNPIYGDKVFGFISSEGVIKIHRLTCPNATNIRKRYPYRIIRTRWSGKIGNQFGATLRIVGRDDIGIVTNITSLINKEKSTSLRNISIESHDGLFSGYVVVGVSDQTSLNNLIKKLKTVKGVKDVQRD